jgi:hypothetical protein
MEKLDKKRAYGVISGEHGGAVFEQDGKMFDGDENEIVVGEQSVGELTAKPAAATKATKAAKAAEPEAKTGEVQEQSALDAQLSQQGA